MAANFQDVVVLASDTLSIQGEQLVLGTAAGSKSIVFAQDTGLASALHLVASNPTAQRTMVLQDANGTLGLITALSAGTTRATGGEIVFSNSNGVSFGINGGTITASYTPGAGGAVNFSAGTTSNDLGSVVFSNANGVSFGLNGSTITASTAAGVLASYFYDQPAGAVSSSAISAAVGSVRLLQIPYPITFSRLDIPVFIALGSSATAATAAVAFTSVAVIYSRSGSTLNPIVGVTGNTTYSWASNSANYSSVLGGRLVSWGLATSLAAGPYYVHIQISTSNSSIGTATTALGMSVSMIYGSTHTVSAFNNFGALTATSIGPNFMQGGMTRVTATSQTLQASQITVTGTPGVRANVVIRLRND